MQVVMFGNDDKHRVIWQAPQILSDPCRSKRCDTGVTQNLPTQPKLT